MKKSFFCTSHYWCGSAVEDRKQEPWDFNTEPDDKCFKHSLLSRNLWFYKAKLGAEHYSRKENNNALRLFFDNFL